MNACIRAVVRTALHHGLEVYGIMHGYQGMIEDQFKLLESDDVGNIIQRGGTILKSSRSKDFLTKKEDKRRLKTCRNTESKEL